MERGGEDGRDRGDNKEGEYSDLVTFDSESKEEINLKIKEFRLDNWESDDSIGILWIQKYVLCVPLRERSPKDKI